MIDWSMSIDLYELWRLKKFRWAHRRSNEQKKKKTSIIKEFAVWNGFKHSRNMTPDIY